MSKLVIVESPAKAKTIQKFLPKDYVVLASLGHVRDLPDNASQLPAEFQGQPWSSLGVNVTADFDAIYVVKDPRSRKALAELKKALKDADELLLATDEDREGEAISWHLLEALKPKVPVKRMVFHEITKSAIEAAIRDTRHIDMHLVSAQETRRILDRLVGYPLSLLVAKKVKYGLSAGRVQSAAVRLLVQRERERRRFREGSYWDIKAKVAHDKDRFDAALNSVDGVRLASGKDFDETTGQIPAGKNVLQLDETLARAIEADLIKKPWAVSDVTHTPYTTSPKPPFTTSTLQQEASRKLNFGAKHTMALAQRLYEDGYITYMRTDSVNLSEQAINAARNAATALYGDAYIPDKPRVYNTKSKNAQEAHEAIRPSGDSFVQPDASGLYGDELRLYDLIWKRTVACQMADARRTSIRIDMTVDAAGKKCLFRANGNKIDFPGYIRAYFEGNDDPEAALEDSETILPALKAADAVRCERGEALPHSTRPPSRYTEASLVRALEEAGIGRPSTYATIMDKISNDDRYARKENKTLIPTFLALAVTELLEKNFPELVDIRFTARMEDDLDAIAAGTGSKVDYLHAFYRAEGAFNDKIERYDKELNPDQTRVITLDDFDGVLRVGKYGPYVQVKDGDEERTINVPADIAPADLTLALLSERKLDGEPVVVGVDPVSGENVYLMYGIYGPYYQLGMPKPPEPMPEPEPVEEGSTKKPKRVKKPKVEKPKRASLPKGADPDTFPFESILKLLSLPRKLGKHPETGKMIDANQGRFGPYLKYNDEYRSLPGGEEQLYNITLEEAVALLATPKASRRGKKTLNELGAHPETGEAVVVMEGKYGPYVNAGKLNATIPRGADPMTVTLDIALALLRERLEQSGEELEVKKPKRGAKKTAEAAEAADGAEPKKAKKPAAAKKATTKKADATATAKPKAKTAAQKKAEAKGSADAALKAAAVKKATDAELTPVAPKKRAKT
jgi:DNA topoisomerase I